MLDSQAGDTATRKVINIAVVNSKTQADIKSAMIDVTAAINNLNKTNKSIANFSGLFNANYTKLNGAINNLPTKLKGNIPNQLAGLNKTAAAGKITDPKVQARSLALLQKIASRLSRSSGGSE